jgi:hypothetical protein
VSAVEQEIRSQALLFDQLQEQEKAVKSRLTTIRAQLLNALETYGESDDKGNLVFPFDEPVGGIRALQKQRRTSTGFDAEAAEEILQSKTLDGKTLWEHCLEYVPMLDDDKVMAMRFDDHLTDDEMARIYPLQVTWAFAPVRLRGRPTRKRTLR